jgi:hypothetical protein
MNRGQLMREARRRALDAQQYEIVEMTARPGPDAPIRARGVTAIGPVRQSGC